MLALTFFTVTGLLPGEAQLNRRPKRLINVKFSERETAPFGQMKMAQLL